MSKFDSIGGVGLMGYISPMDTRDTYFVSDPIYGIDGLRNVATIAELNQISFERRRAGMIVGVGGGEVYYKLKNISDWNFDLTDWDELNLKQRFSNKETPNGTIDDNNNIFFLNNTPIEGTEHVYLNGLLMDDSDDYFMEENKITFNYPPPLGSKLKCTYQF